ncbi:MAG TPA: hypothetical protein VFP97_09080 [Chitinophagaceae bacterium]|nr:hypothetical protein [Chitinophagaceae bacterium]
MIKIFPLIVISFFIATGTIHAQSEKKGPPPPPKVIKAGIEKPIPGVIKEEETKGPPVITVKGKLADEFYERNPSVSEISRQGNIITLKKKDGTTEKYDMSKKEEDKRFTGKYGYSPIPPPPPPPKVVGKE